MTVEEYTEICVRFAEDTKDWGGIDTRFFVTFRGGWVSSCDNRHGGIGVRWAYQKSEAEIRALARRKYEEWKALEKEFADRKSGANAKDMV